MAKKTEPPLLEEGNIVEITNSTDKNLIGCKGEVITTKPLQIAVVHLLPFEAEQVKKIFDANADWETVRTEAKKNNIKLKGTKEVIVAKINEHHKDQARVEVAVEEAPSTLRRGSGVQKKQRVKTASSPASDAIFKNDCVLININNSNAKGRVSRTDLGGRKPFAVVVCTRNELQTQTFKRKELTRKGGENYPESVGEDICGAKCNKKCWPPKV